MSDFQEKKNTAVQSINHIKRFFSNPLFGVVGSISGVIGIILFMASRTSPNLVYYVDPERASVVRVNQSSRLHIEIDGEAVNRNVTAAQIIIWNDGEESVRGKNLLSPFILKTGPHNPIIEADIQKVTREVIGLRLNKSKIHEGQLGVDWTILEQGDGTMVQLIYFGDDKTSITASAIVEQQGDVWELEYDWGKGKGVFGLLTSLVLLVFALRTLLDVWEYRIYATILALIIILLVVMVTISIYPWTEPTPPF